MLTICLAAELVEKIKKSKTILKLCSKKNVHKRLLNVERRTNETRKDVHLENPR